MKKSLLFFSLLFVFLFATSGGKVFAQEISTSPAVLKVQYDLPYSGILPDNSLYFLKALRDNVLNLLITDPLKKANYDLLMADKRLSAASALLDKGKVDLAITTLSKSGNYFSLAIQQASSAQKQGENTDEILSTLLIASLKHQQIIVQMEEKTNGAARQVLQVSQKRAEDLQKSVELLKAK
ncbi:MAG TPA: DUF5667 domain-containing protein [Patescibacteria group bacterium]|jgi:hypothetical protein|nr:DUF5667 domain-containing protein [Patescibacteria group bacterium]